MIACTEFIPAYSELFTYLEEQKGREEVDRYWHWLFDPSSDSTPLDSFVQKSGIRGCFDYWSISLTEEAADFTQILNEKAGWYRDIMHHCPSKGRLIELHKEVPEFIPYHDYCLHCDNYRLALKRGGLEYIYDFQGIDEAKCQETIYDPKVFDGRIIIDENCEIMDVRATDNEYFHQRFHASMSNGIDYLTTNYGKKAIEEYMRAYMNHVWPRILEKCESEGLSAVEDFIHHMFKKEKADELVTTELSSDGSTLKVSVSKDPQIAYLRENGLKIAADLPMTTTVPLTVLAEHAGATFVMESYDEETGARTYSFVK
ncbi:MAG: hypothetical protein Q4B67_00005 [Eubacteriales bacterium]|nr:hypothetical protein [Eubacteriales bacterium]